ncbi:MAG: DnaA/Hda family protein, partial [Polyangia bacterium]
MPAESCEGIARPPVQLTFDRFIIGPENQFAAVAAKMLAGPEPPCFNPLVIRGVQGAGKSMLLRAMGTEYGRLAPSKNVALGLGTELLRAHAAGDLSVLAQADLLLLDEVDGFRAGTTRALERVLRERAEAGRLTVLALQIGQGAGLLRFCTKEFPRGLSVELLPPSADTRREILLRHLREHGVAVEEAASASLTFVPWESAVDVEALGERLLHAA